MTTAVSTSNHVTAATCLQSFLDACTRKRESLIASEKARTHSSILIDSDYDRITGYMQNWKRRYMAAHRCTSALCPIAGDVRDTSYDPREVA